MDRSVHVPRVLRTFMIRRTLNHAHINSIAVGTLAERLHKNHFKRLLSGQAKTKMHFPVVANRKMQMVMFSLRRPFGVCQEAKDFPSVCAEKRQFQQKAAAFH